MKTAGIFIGLLWFGVLSAQNAKDSLIRLKAEQFYTKGDFSSAFTLYKDSLLPLYEKSDTSYINVLNTLALIKETTGEYEAAEAYALESIRMAARVPISAYKPNHANFLSGLAFLYGRLNRNEEAEQLYKQALDILLSSEQSPAIYASVLNNLAILYRNTERYEEAEPLYKEALSIWEKHSGKQSDDYIAGLNNLATFYQAIEKNEKSAELYETCLKILESKQMQKHPRYVITLNNLAMVYKNLELYTQSEKLYKLSLNIQEQTTGKTHPTYAIILTNISGLYINLKKFDRVKEFLQTAIDIRTKAFGKQHPETIGSINGLARCFKHLEQIDSCLHYACLAIHYNMGKDSMQQAATIDQNWSATLCDASFVNLPILFTSLEHLYWSKQGDWTTRQLICKTALQIMDNYSREFQLESDKMRLLSLSNAWITRILHCLNALQKTNPKNSEHYQEQIFRYMEMSKGALLSMSLQNQRAKSLSDLPDSLILRELSLQKQRDQIKKKLSEKNHTEEELQRYSSEMNTLNLDIDAFQKQMRESYPKYYELKYQNRSTSLSDIQKTLSADHLFLQYTIGLDSMIYVMAVHAQSTRFEAINISKKLFDSKADALRTALSDYGQIKTDPVKNKKNYTESAHWFYKTLIESILEHFPSSQRLIIVTDGALGHLPFEAFLTQPVDEALSYKEMPYLVKKYAISYVYSAKAFQEYKTWKEKRKNNGQLLAMAASYTGTDEKREERLPGLMDKRREGLNDLPSAKLEVSTLQARFSGDFYFDKDATENRFKAMAGNYALIHLAMHGTMNKRAPILSSLIFTETGDSTEDDFLEAWEIAHLQLNADLAVLSACETGYGNFAQGEGILSLARSFMYAGVPALVVSLWEVNDNATSTIMQLFYEELFKGKDKDLALQSAKLNYLNNSTPTQAHPAFWSAFIQIGDTAPARLSGNKWTYWFVGAVLGLVVFGWWSLRRFRKKRDREL